jgi:outer membrane lipoprotein-sorting protein
MLSLFTIIMTVLLFSSPTPAAQPDAMTTDAMAVLKEMKEVFEPSRPRKGKVVITMTRKGEAVQNVAGQAVKMFPDGKRMLWVLLEPKDVKGMGFLIKEQKDKTEAMWIYLPSMDREKEIVGLVDQYGSFLGTDFTYADLGFVGLGGKYTLMARETHGGKEAFKVVETLPKDNIYFTEIITWIAADTKLPLQRDFYTKNGSLWKTLLFEQVSVIDGIPTPMRITMKDVQSGNSTELKFSEVAYGADIPESLFESSGLRDAARHECWKPYCTVPPQAP